jgi:uncharacterized protein YggU (UPF0235/DUF167 family)
MKIIIKVKPNSLDSCIIKKTDNEFFAQLKSPAEDNKANIELIKLISKYFNISANKIKIKFGLKGRDKIVDVG